MSRRDEVLDAAVGVLGEQGLYGLTHRKVDQAGRLPEGTTSNHFRTRAKLLAGAVDHLVKTDVDVWDRGGVPDLSSADDLAGVAAQFVQWAVTDGRPRSIARIALLEAALTDPDVADVLRSARREIEERATAVCVPLGLDQTGTAALLDATDAVIFRLLAMPDPGFEALPYFTLLVDGLRAQAR